MIKIIGHFDLEINWREFNDEAGTLKTATKFPLQDKLDLDKVYAIIDSDGATRSFVFVACKETGIGGFFISDFIAPE